MSKSIGFGRIYANETRGGVYGEKAERTRRCALRLRACIYYIYNKMKETA